MRAGEGRQRVNVSGLLGKQCEVEQRYEAVTYALRFTLSQCAAGLPLPTRVNNTSMKTTGTITTTTTILSFSELSFYITGSLYEFRNICSAFYQLERFAILLPRTLL